MSYNPKNPQDDTKHRPIPDKGGSTQKPFDKSKDLDKDLNRDKDKYK